MDRLETTYDARPAARAKAPRHLKECFSNFYCSLGAHDSTMPDVANSTGTNRMMIGSDYPHPDGTFPNTVQMLRAREGLTKQDIFFFLMIPPPPRSTLFPYTTLFR